MPRGRHRHSPPLHRLLPPSVIAGVSVVCAVGPWLFTEPLVLRGLAAGAAATTAVGSVVMRRWDLAAGKRVADLTRARASDEWRHEERVAELETDLDESRELRTKLEQKLRAKRTELANLRNEHAALLRRYATAETERASALEGRRLLAIETTGPAKALPAAEPKPPAEQETPDDAEDLVAASAGDAAAAEDAEPSAEDAEPSTARVFSPEGSSLFMRADSALVRLIKDNAEAQEESGASESDDAESDAEEDGTQAAGTDPAGDDEAQADGAAQDGEAAEPAAVTGDGQPGRTPKSAPRSAGRKATAKASPPEGGPGNGGGRKPNAAPEAPESAAKEGGSAEAVEAEGKPTAVAGPEHAAAPTAQQPQPSVTRPPHASGHFTVPTAVAVVPAAPRRRPTVEGGFDFFGTQKSRESLESVQNEDLADVVGQEALAMHKAESESGFKAMDPQARGMGQVIDLTAHDETEQIDVQGLRTAAS